MADLSSPPAVNADAREWEDEAYPNASPDLRRALRSQRTAIRAFLASDLGRLDAVLPMPGPVIVPGAKDNPS